MQLVTKRLVLREFREEQPRTKYQLAVTLQHDGQLIGTCGIRLASAGAHEGDIGYELSSRHWGRGYATEAARAIVHFGFTELQLHRIWSWCIADNVGSAHVLEKLGMRRGKPLAAHGARPTVYGWLCSAGHRMLQDDALGPFPRTGT